MKIKDNLFLEEFKQADNFTKRNLVIEAVLNTIETLYEGERATGHFVISLLKETIIEVEASCKDMPLKEINERVSKSLG